jgi:hypothetical protein
VLADFVLTAGLAFWMRARLLGVAEVMAWTAASFSLFLGLRTASIFLSLVDPAQCTDACGVGAQVIPLTLLTYGLGWFPLVLVHFARLARRGSERWFLLHTLVVVVAHVVAMVVVVRIFADYGDADTRTSILAACAGCSDVLAGLALVAGIIVRPLPSPREEDWSR